MLNVKAKMATVSMPAMLSGSTTRGMAPTREQPSTMAASSISIGMGRKNPAMSHVQNGMVNVGYATISDPSLSNNPSAAITLTSGRNSSVVGIRYVRKMPMDSV